MNTDSRRSITIKQDRTDINWKALQNVTDLRWRLKAPIVNYLIERGLRYPEEGQEFGVTTTKLEEAPTKIGDADFRIQSLPLPMTWKSWNSKTLAKDNWWPEAAARRVAESVERTLFTGWKSGEYEIKGLLNADGRLELTSQLGPMDAEAKIKHAIKELDERKWYGPFLVLHSPDYDRYLDSDAPGEDPARRTLENKIRQDVEKVADVMGVYAYQPPEKDKPPTDLLPEKTLILVQLTPEVVRMVVSQKLVVSEWDCASEEEDKRDDMITMCVIVPQIRKDWRGSTGIAVVRG